jgi:hypothetical protein
MKKLNTKSRQKDLNNLINKSPSAIKKEWLGRDGIRLTFENGQVFKCSGPLVIETLGG